MIIIDSNGRIVRQSHPLNILSVDLIGPLGAADKVFKVSADGLSLEWGDPVGAASVATDVIWDVKGDLAAATGANAAARLAVGTTGQVLSADPTQPSGLKWIDATAGAMDILQMQVFS